MVNEVLAYLRSRSSDDESGQGQGNEENTGLRVFIDATLGTAGHTIELLKADSRNRVIAFDRDRESMRFAAQRLKKLGYLEKVALVQCDFRVAHQALKELGKVAEQGAFKNPNFSGFEQDGSLLENTEEREVQRDETASDSVSAAPKVLWVGEEFPLMPIPEIAGALIDAGMSLYQVSWAERGLSFRADAPLDMRYDRTRGVSAFELVNELSQDELEELFFKFTDERWARRIAEFIAEHRRRQVIRTTSELAAIIEAAIPAGVRRRMHVHPATRAFAALRLAVNDEYWALEEGVWALSAVLANTARLVVLTYSSHEDRTVKRTFRRLSGRPLETEDRFERSRKRHSALSPKRNVSSMRPPLTPFFGLDEFSLRLPSETDQNQVPDWIEGFESDWKMNIVTKKPVEPSEAEVQANPLARSCKLRSVEKEVLAENKEKPRV